MRVLLVEDDPKSAGSWCAGSARTAPRRPGGGRRCRRSTWRAAEDYDAILLDVMLPGARRLRGLPAAARRSGVDTPVLDDHRPRRRGRPRARARRRRRRLPGQAVRLRRAAGAAAGAWQARPHPPHRRPARLRARSRSIRAAHTVAVRGAAARLTATEYRLLEFLVRRAEAIVSRDQLARARVGRRLRPAARTSPTSTSATSAASCRRRSRRRSSTPCAAWATC